MQGNFFKNWLIIVNLPRRRYPHVFFQLFLLWYSPLDVPPVEDVAWQKHQTVKNTKSLCKLMACIFVQVKKSLRLNLSILWNLAHYARPQKSRGKLISSTVERLCSNSCSTATGTWSMVLVSLAVRTFAQAQWSGPGVGIGQWAAADRRCQTNRITKRRYMGGPAHVRYVIRIVKHK